MLCLLGIRGLNLQEDAFLINVCTTAWIWVIASFNFYFLLFIIIIYILFASFKAVDGSKNENTWPRKRNVFVPPT